MTICRVHVHLLQFKSDRGKEGKDRAHQRAGTPHFSLSPLQRVSPVTHQATRSKGLGSLVLPEVLLTVLKSDKSSTWPVFAATDALPLLLHAFLI
jgi:hypothetical protein